MEKTQQAIREGFRLSPQQRRLWDLQRNDDERAYQTRCVLRLHGELRRSALLMALAQVVRNHEILRTSFHRPLGMTIPVQVVESRREVYLHEVDIANCAVHEQLRVQNQLFEAEALPAREELLPLRFILILRSPRESVLILCLPALVMDRAGFDQLVKELALAYGDVLASRKPTFEATQYLDFSEWQNAILEDVNEQEEGRLFWQGKSLSIEPRPALPDQRRENTRKFFTPRELVKPVPSLILENLERKCQNLGCPTEIFLLTCWQLLLSRLLKEDRVTLSVAFDGRRFEELRGVLGRVERLLPVHNRIGGTYSFREALTQTYDRWQETFDWQEYFDWQAVDVDEQDNGHVPFSAFSFHYAETGRKGLSAGGVLFEIERARAVGDRFVIQLHCWRRKRAPMLISWIYDSELLDQRSVSQLSRQYFALLRDAIARPECCVSLLDILSEGERHWIVHELNDTASRCSSARSLHGLVEEHMRRVPERIAVISEECSVSYSELESRANGLAHELLRSGLTPGSRCGLCVDRSVEMLVGILGVLKAGGAYVPLDPDYPPERFNFLLADAGVSMVLSTEKFLGRMREFGGPWIDIDQVSRSDEGVDRLVVSSLLEYPAYVIYTSGSTGHPKGVVIRHSNAVHSTEARRDVYQGPLDRFLLLSSFAFDSSVAGIFGSLCSGGTLVLAAKGGQGDPEVISERISAHRVSHLLTLPSLYYQLLEAAPPDSLTSLKVAIVAGESCPAPLPARHAERLPDVLLYNEYGPTEATVWSTVQRCSFSPGQGATIGRPISNTRIYLLDRFLQSVPKSCIGEVYIEGEGLSSGYFGRPGVTAERFLPNSFSAKKGARWYRTGDLARLRHDGEIEFLGRVDHQVKIRGYRIELEEIETVLHGHPNIHEAVVAVCGENPAEYQLVAYLLAKVREETQSAADLRVFAARVLPDFMVPSMYVWLDDLPRNPNGKVDRSSLPDPREISLEQHSVSPRTPTEELVAGVWAEALNRERIGVRDNVFELGAHSLMATRVSLRLRELFSVDLGVRQLFEAPTVSELAAIVESTRLAEREIHVPAMRFVDRRQPLPLSFAQQRLWLLDELGLGGTAYNVPAAVRLIGSLDVAALEASFNKIVRRHEALRTIFVSNEGVASQVILDAVRLEVAIADVSGLQELYRDRESRRLISREAQRPFDLAVGPLLRSLVICLGARDHIVLVTMHHIVSDAWSAEIFMGELAALYRSCCSRERPSLPDLPLQYADYAVWQRQWLRGEVLAEQLNYWRKQLSGAPGELRLPFDRKRSLVSSRRGSIYHFMISDELTSELRQLGRRHQVTLFMILLAAFKALLRAITGQADFLVGTPIANRARLETEALIGFFVNTLVLRSDLSGDPTFEVFLQRVREMVLEAHTWQDLPFDKLLDELRPDRSSDRSPLFQVWFVFQNSSAMKLEVPGLSLEPVEVYNGEVRHDLKLDLMETSQGIRGFLEYPTEAFELSTVEWIHLSFIAILEEIAVRTQVRLSKLVDAVEEINCFRRKERRKGLRQDRQQALSKLQGRAVVKASSTGGEGRGQ